MNFNHKKAENNSIKFVHYLNDSLCSICHPTSSKSNINKQNTTQMTKSSLNPKINLENSFFNQNKNKNNNRFIYYYCIIEKKLLLYIYIYILKSLFYLKYSLTAKN